jgi:hypothetical protein
VSTPDLEEIETISRRHRQLGEVIADLAQQRIDLEARFEQLVPVGFETVIDGQPVYRKPPNRSFNLTTAVSLCRELGYQVKQHWEYDADDAKRLLKQAGRLDDAMLPGAGKTRVKL